MAGRRVRAIDIFGTQALARVPTLAMAALALVPGFQRAILSFIGGLLVAEVISKVAIVLLFSPLVSPK